MYSKVYWTLLKHIKITVKYAEATIQNDFGQLVRLEPCQSVNLLRMSTSGPKKILTLISRRKACSDPLSFCYTAIPQLHHIVQRTHASAVSRCHIHLYLLQINYTCAHCLVPDVHFLHLHFNHKAKTSSIFCTNPSIDYVCFPVQLLQLSSHPCNGSVSAPRMRMPRKEVYI